MFNFDWAVTAFNYFMGIEIALGWKIILVFAIVWWLLTILANSVEYLQKKKRYKEIMARKELEGLEELTGKMH
jgi:hypothetical protein